MELRGKVCLSVRFEFHVVLTVNGFSFMGVMMSMEVAQKVMPHIIFFIGH